MASLKEVVDLEAPVVQVWDAVHEDLESVPRWSPNLVKVEVLGPGRGQGARVRYHLRLPGGLNERVDVEQTVFTPPKRCAGKFVGGPLTGTWSYTYVEADGLTRLTYEMNFQLKGVLKFTTGMFAGQYTAGIRENFQLLKEYIEEGLED